MNVAPLVFHPAWSKQELFLAAKAYMASVLEHWVIPRPSFIGGVPPTTSLEQCHLTYGYYDLSKVYVDVARSVAVEPGTRRYSYPGNKSDHSCAGITAHGCGHHVWYILSHRGDPRLYNWAAGAFQREKISTDEATVECAFAETVRLLALNPDLLRLGAPRRYQFITEILRLRPPHNLAWQTVLGRADNPVKKQAQSWAKEMYG